MSAPTVLAQPALRQTLRDLRSVIIGVGAGLLLLGLLFHNEIGAAITVWRTSTAYNHCFLVLPIAAYLVWDRRASLRGMTIAPVPVLAFAAIPMVLVWLVADRLGIMEGRQLVAMTIVQLLFLAVLGWRSWWMLSGPLLYLYFLVPFGAFVTTHLQHFTTDFVQVGLSLVHIPAYIDGFTIQIPQGSFYIAEACAGLRFLIASVAFGALYSILMYRSPARRGLFMLASVIVPIIANGFRALGIVVLAYFLGSAKAAATDHIIYGWVFFSIVILMLIALGLPFREDQPPAEPPLATDSKPLEPRALHRALLTVGLVCVFALIGPGVTLALGAGGMTRAAAPAFNPGRDCVLESGSHAAPLPHHPSSARNFNCGGFPVQVQTVTLPRRATSEVVFAAERALIDKGGEDGVSVSWLRPAANGTRTWRLVQSPNLGFITAAGLWVDGKPTQLSLALRLHLALTSIIGTHFAPVLVTVTPEENLAKLGQEQRRRVLDRLVRLVEAWPNVNRKVRLIATGR